MNIEHLSDQQKFVASINDAQVVLEYALSDNSINFTHTYVPFSLRGKGYAEQIVAHGLQWAKSEGLLVSASCWYVAKFLK